MSQERWSAIRGYEGEYEVSDLGRVRSIKSGGLILKPDIKRNGYHTVCLWHKNSKKNRLVHRLVAEAFLPNPSNLEEINHLDEDKGNNRLDNLEWCSRKYNMNYGNIKTKMSEAGKGKIPWCKGKKCPQISAALLGKKHPHKGHPGLGGRKRKEVN